MSWQSQWGTVKATNARAAALYYEVANVGKTIESSKKRVIWRLKVEEGREFEISLTHSLASGKKVLRVDSIVKYSSQSLSFGDWDYVFNLPGGHCVHIIIKPSVELNDMYDLIIDGVSFRRLPERLDPNRIKKNVTTASTANSARKPPSYSYSNGNYQTGSGSNSRNTSFGPWECARCTLVNEKPLAPICEACGAAKPDYISPESRQRAKTVAQSPATTPAPRPSSRSAATPPTTDFFSSDFSATTANASASNGFGAFSTPAPAFAASAATSLPPPPRRKSNEDISSMLAGLDFTPTAIPVAEEPPAQFVQAPQPTDDTDEAARTGSSDLWTSSIVDLNLRPEDKVRATRPAKAYQTLEQARLQAPKEKVAVLQPPPPPQTQAMTVVAPMGYYATAAQVPGGFYNGVQPMYNTAAQGGAGYPTMGQPAYNGYGAPPAQGQYQFMTAAAPVGQGSFQKPQVPLSADPFATLS